jgi:hypothetical protein
VLRAKGESVLLGGVGRAEVVPGSPSLRHCFFPQIHVGPYRIQVRLTCVFSEAERGRVGVEVLELNPGVVNPVTGDIEFQKDPSDLLDAPSEVEIAWREAPAGRGLRVAQRARQQFKLRVPWWFPVQDSLMKAVIQPFVARAIEASQAGVLSSLRKQLALAERVPTPAARPPTREAATLGQAESAAERRLR